MKHVQQSKITCYNEQRNIILYVSDETCGLGF